MPDKQVKKRNNKGQFVKGVSGNPDGRAKKGSAIADILNAIGDEKITIGNKTITKREAVLIKVYSEAVKGKEWAAKFIADRTEGKALERVIKQKVDDIVEIK